MLKSLDHFVPILFVIWLEPDSVTCDSDSDVVGIEELDTSDIIGIEEIDDLDVVGIEKVDNSSDVDTGIIFSNMRLFGVARHAQTEPSITEQNIVVDLFMVPANKYNCYITYVNAI